MLSKAAKAAKAEALPTAAEWDMPPCCAHRQVSLASQNNALSPIGILFSCHWGLESCNSILRCDCARSFYCCHADSAKTVFGVRSMHRTSGLHYPSPEPFASGFDWLRTPMKHQAMEG